MMDRTSNLNRIIEEVLRWSSAASILVMAVGLSLFLLMGPESAFRPGAVMSAGIIMLVSIPFLRVTGCFITFLYVDRDIKYALISLGLLVILVAGLLLPRVA